MGGNVFNDIGGSRRINNFEYNEYKESIRTKINGAQILSMFPDCVRSKTSHGDVDVLVDNTKREEVRRLFAQYQNRPNGPVDSMLIDGVQVDFIYIPREEMYYAYNYFSWNDLGNLIGRIAHKMGLKHGHDGLHMVVRDGTHVIGEITLTDHYITALDFLGFDYVRYLKGFDSFEDMYKFVADNERFDPRIYDLDNRNHTARVRDKKRPVYTNFLLWIEENKTSLRRYDWPTDKSVWQEYIFDYFKAAREEYRDMMFAYNHKKAAAMILNGERVMHITGLTGKDVGRIMQAVKESEESWVEWVLLNGEKAVDQRIMDVYNLIFNNNGA